MAVVSNPVVDIQTNWKSNSGLQTTLFDKRPGDHLDFLSDLQQFHIRSSEFRASPRTCLWTSAARRILLYVTKRSSDVVGSALPIRARRGGRHLLLRYERPIVTYFSLYSRISPSGYTSIGNGFDNLIHRESSCSTLFLFRFLGSSSNP